MRQKMGLCVALAMCLLLAAVLAPLAGSLVTPSPEAAGDGTPAVGNTNTELLSGEGESSVGAGEAGFPDRREPIPAGLSVWDGVVHEENDWTQEKMEAYIAAVPFAGGTGTSSDPYRIATPEQFVHFVQLCRYSLQDAARNRLYRELSYELTADLCFNPDFVITDDVKAGKITGINTVPYVDVRFEGTLNGAGHRLYNIYQTQKNTAGGLFTELSANATVTGIHLVRGYIGCGKSDAPSGGIAAVCHGSITGCSVSATLCFAGAGGGIVGTIGTADASISGCEFAGELYATGVRTTRDGVPMLYVPNHALGGILGSCTTPIVTTSISDCINRGVVSSVGRMVGGIVGSVYNAGKTVGGIGISNCVNFGEVTSTYDPTTDMSNPTTIRASYVGGIVGFINRISSSGKKSITGVANFGRVSALNTGTAGGILGSGQSDQGASLVLTIQNAYNWGEVSAPNRVGGLVGHVQTRIQVMDSAVFGQVTGGADVGGLIGLAEPPTWYSSPSVRIDQTVMHATVSATAGSAGGLIGVYLLGGAAELTIGGVFVSSAVSATDGSAGGWIGRLAVYQNESGEYRSKTKLTLSGTYSLLDGTFVATGENASRGLWFGTSLDGSTGNAVAVTGLFSVVCARERGDADFPREMPGAESGNMAFASELFRDEGLTDGTYREALNTFAGNKGYRKWEQTADGPMLPTIAHLALLPLTHPYNGEAISLEDNRWAGAMIAVRYWQYDAGSGIWEELAAPPKNVGRYRVEAAVLSLRACGAVVREFEIEKQVFDLSLCRWPETTSYEYIGEEQTVTLSGLPEVAVPTYEGNRATLRNTYTARLLSIDDPTGNYAFIGLSSVPAFVWKITEVDIDFGYVTWRGSTPEDKQHATTVYSEEEQTLCLYYTKKPNIDLSKIMTIVYSNNVATSAGIYPNVRAEIKNDDRFDSITFSGDGIVQTNYVTEWEIKKREINPDDYLDFSDMTVTYDGKEHTIDCSSRLPSCVMVTYDGIPHRDAGEYVYTVQCTLTDTENNRLTATSASRRLTISRAIAKITAKGRDTVYNGEVQRIEEEKCRLNTDATNDTPLRFEYYLVSEGNGALVPVADNAPIHGGDYQVKVLFDGSRNYEPAAVTVPLYINRATLALEGDIVLRNAELLYTGEPLNLKLENERHLPDCVIPVYSTPRTEPGIYKVIVDFEFTDEHKNDYKPIAGMSATMTILTSKITDEETGLQVRFPDGSPVPYRLLVLARKDLDAFNTNWSVGFHTSLKGLWKTELKEGTKPITNTEEPFDVYLPLSVKDSNDRSLTAVGLSIDEKGKYSIKVYPDAEVVDIGEDSYLRISTTEVTYFGYTTRDDASGQVLWTVLAVVAAVPAAVVITVEIVRHRRRKAAGRRINDK